MAAVTIELPDDLVALLHQFNQPLQHSVRELIVLELYRRGVVSSGKTAQLLGIGRWELVHCAPRLGIPYFALTPDAWATERAQSATL